MELLRIKEQKENSIHGSKRQLKEVASMNKFSLNYKKFIKRVTNQQNIIRKSIHSKKNPENFERKKANPEHFNYRNNSFQQFASFISDQK